MSPEAAENASPRRLCLSVRARSAAGVADAARAAPPEVGLVELRLDLLDPREIRSGAWRGLPSDENREWVFTWRSPREGGGGARPPGLFREALDAGFHWIDVEAGDLDGKDAEARAVPSERRWVSHHRTEPVETPNDVDEAWASAARHPAALTKCVVTAERFRVNTWVLDRLRELAGGGSSRTLFAQGWMGHASRVLGYLAGNSVTFVSESRTSATSPGQPSWENAVRAYRLPRLTPKAAVYGVLGNPVRNSRSPQIHNAAFSRLGLDACYIPLEADRVDDVLAWVREGRLHGVSVTAPWKGEAFARMDRCEADAVRLRAVNTVWREDRDLVGGNTDVEAARILFERLVPEKEGKVAVLGAGGAAAALVGATLDLGLTPVVFNRSAKPGQALAARLGAQWGGALEELEPEGMALVANATPMGSGFPMPERYPSHRWNHTAIADLSYGEDRSPWRELAERDGSRFSDGLEFLAVQARGQLRRWTGVEPAEDVSE